MLHLVVNSACRANPVSNGQIEKEINPEAGMRGDLSYTHPSKCGWDYRTLWQNPLFGQRQAITSATAGRASVPSLFRGRDLSAA
jgi:hypothetical protein